ncbi:MAG: CxxxxCH/CxxCH domain c-type cytochrome [Myxococcota bacterium]
MRSLVAWGVMVARAGCGSSSTGTVDGGRDAARLEGGAGKDGSRTEARLAEQGPVADAANPGCLGCHGSAKNLAPPLSVGGKSATSERGVGAHQSHLGSSTWHAELTCNDCHVVPAKVVDPGHIDTALPAELAFSALATTGGAKPAWDGTTCAGAYCHGATLSGGSQTTPSWTKVDGTQAACGTCHGLPPAAPHPQNSACSGCHGAVVDAAKKIIAPALHVNGKVEASAGGHPSGWGAGSVHGAAFLKGPDGCKACHGGSLTGGSAKSCESCHPGWQTKCTFCHGGTLNQTGAPPTTVAGQTAISVPGVGRHTAHVVAGASHAAFGCAICHGSVPANALSPGHIDPSPAEVKFTGAGAGSTYSFTTYLCSNMYCHGNGKPGSTGSAPWVGSWTGGCSACHDDETDGQAMTLSGRHEKHIVDKKLGCASCHSCVVNGSKQIVDPAKHVNGARDVCNVGWNATARTCTPAGCHGTESW